MRTGIWIQEFLSLFQISFFERCTTLHCAAELTAMVNPAIT